MHWNFDLLHLSKQRKKNTEGSLSTQTDKLNSLLIKQAFLVFTYKGTGQCEVSPYFVISGLAFHLNSTDFMLQEPYQMKKKTPKTPKQTQTSKR